MISSQDPKKQSGLQDSEMAILESPAQQIISSIKQGLQSRQALEENSERLLSRWVTSYAWRERVTGQHKHRDVCGGTPACSTAESDRVRKASWCWGAFKAV